MADRYFAYDLKKKTTSGEDYFYVSTDIGPKSGRHVGYALSEAGSGQNGTLTDNYGNMLLPFRLFTTEHGETRMYNLSLAQWNSIRSKMGGIGREADQHPQKDNHKILILDHFESPLKTLSRELEDAHTPYTLIGPAAQSKCPSQSGATTSATSASNSPAKPGRAH